MANEVWIGELRDTPLGEIWVACSAEGVTAMNLWGDRTQFEAQVRRLTGKEPIYDVEQVAEATRQTARLPRPWLPGNQSLAVAFGRELVALSGVYSEQ
jgi:hypothetical protein